jgi:hypothetical protein
VERVAGVARKRKLHVVIGTDGVHERSRASLWHRLLTFQAPPAGTALEELEQVLRALGQAGAQVTVIDRGSGRVLRSADRRALLGFGQQAQAGQARAVSG